MWQIWYMKWRTAEFLNDRNTEEILSERGEGSMKLGESVGVSSETANRDACRMEHAISEESYLKIQQLVKRMKKEKLLDK